VQTRAEISRLHQRLGTTFVYVTHDQVEAMTMATRIAVMNEGVLQQVGSPQELYDHPTNVFVAGFIGSPAMNFFEGSVRRVGGGIVIASDGFDIEVPQVRRDSFAPLEGRELTFGMRPEHIHDPAFVPAGTVPAPLDAQVEITELMGNETFLHLQRGETSLLARVDPRTAARAGSQTSVVMDLTHLRAFDATSGEAVPLEVPSTV